MTVTQVARRYCMWCLNVRGEVFSSAAKANCVTEKCPLYPPGSRATLAKVKRRCADCHPDVMGVGMKQNCRLRECQLWEFSAANRGRVKRRVSEKQRVAFAKSRQSRHPQST